MLARSIFAFILGMVSCCFAIIFVVMFCDALSQSGSLDLRHFVALTSFASLMSVTFAILTVLAWLRAIDWLDWSPLMAMMARTRSPQPRNRWVLCVSLIEWMKKRNTLKPEPLIYLCRRLFGAVVVLGLLGLIAAASVTAFTINDIGPKWFNGLDVMIASISGIMFGGGLGAWLNVIAHPRHRTCISLVLFIIGLAYVAIGAHLVFQDNEIVWIDVYYASGGAMAGASLSVILNYIRRLAYQGDAEKDITGGSH